VFFKHLSSFTTPSQGGAMPIDGVGTGICIIAKAGQIRAAGLRLIYFKNSTLRAVSKHWLCFVWGVLL
jgi:hypothetical protein